MNDTELTDAERALIETLPRPPAIAKVHTTNVWIVEWLWPDERRTGRELHEWMQHRRPGWSIYCACETKAEVIESIERAQLCAQHSEMVPVLHLEAHGGNAGLTPSSDMHAEWLSWEELTVPLQRLNLAARCNLVVVVAACVGFAAVQALCQGPRAPAIALVGPDADVAPSNLLLGAKEFYRRWGDENSILTDIAANASREIGTAHFECEPFAMLFHEAMAESLVRSIRPTERLKRIERLRQRLLAETEIAASQIENRLAQLPLVRPWDELQQVWDQMFMIDIYPENRERFGIDMKEIVERIDRVAAGGGT